MKKWMAVVMLAIVMLSSSITVLAGDIPESLLYSEEAQLFFGEVLAYHPNKENPSISVSPIVAIKGDVKEGTQQIYNNPNTVGDFNIQEGKVYLFIYCDGVNPLDIFEVTTYDTRTLKLKHVEGSMWERFEKYLNEGKYGEARIEGMLPYRVDIIRGIIGAVVCLVIVSVVIIYVKKRPKASSQSNGGDSMKKVKKIATWLMVISIIVFAIAWGVIGLKIFTNDFNFMTEAYIGYGSLAVFFTSLICVKMIDRCPHCGKTKQPFGKYCPYCGKEIK